MDKEQIAIYKDRILLTLANKERTYKELADIMRTDIYTIITISKELKNDGLIHIIDTSSKTSKNDGILNILPEGRFFTNNSSYKNKYEKRKLNKNNIKLFIEILMFIIAAIGLYYTINQSR